MDITMQNKTNRIKGIMVMTDQPQIMVANDSKIVLPENVENIRYVVYQ